MDAQTKYLTAIDALTLAQRNITPARGRLRSGYTKNHGQGLSKQRRRMEKASRRRNRGT